MWYADEISNVRLDIFYDMNLRSSGIFMWEDTEKQNDDILVKYICIKCLSS